MTSPADEYLIIGKIGAAYGIKGWLKIHSLTDPTDHILQYSPWYLPSGKTWESIKIETGRPHGKGIVIKLKGVDTPEAARLFTGKKIAIKREQLAPLPKNEYYWADLEGLMVVDQNGVSLGKVSYLLETGSNDVLVIRDELGKEHAIPYLPGQVVQEVSLEQKIIRVDWELI